MSNKRPSRDDLETFDRLPKASKLPLTYTPPIWTIEGAPGVYGHVTDETKHGLMTAFVPPGEVMARVPSGTGDRAVRFKRLVELETYVIRLAGHELVEDLDLVICDICGLGTLTSVEVDMSTILCRPCAAGLTRSKDRV